MTKTEQDKTIEEIAAVAQAVAEALKPLIAGLTQFWADNEEELTSLIDAYWLEKNSDQSDVSTGN